MGGAWKRWIARLGILVLLELHDRFIRRYCVVSCIASDDRWYDCGYSMTNVYHDEV